MRGVKWVGVGGGTDHDILLAHLAIAERRGSFTYYASVHELAQRAGVTRMTTSRANSRLARSGWIRLEVPASHRTAQVWQLVPRKHCDTTVTYRSHRGREEGCNDSVAELSHDAFRWGGVGKVKRLVYTLLTPERGFRVDEIAKAQGVCARSAQRHLRDLERHGLAQRGADKLWRRTQNAELDELAKTLGTLGKGEIQHEKYRSQREAYLTLPSRRRLGFPSSAESARDSRKN
jgi:DNA-binding MarR family transcriptional regulator